jgi:hypothetical protein
MNMLRFFFFGAIMVLLHPNSFFAQQPVLPESKGHPFVCADYTQGKVFIVSEKGKIVWEYEAPDCNDVWVLPNGNLLFNTGHGVKEVTRDKKVIFLYESASEIYACQRLENGNTFVGECSSGRLLEISTDGKIQKEINLLPEGKTGGHTYMRNARKLPNGNYLVAHYGEDVVREYNSNGTIVRELPAPGGPHSVVRLPDGNTLIACADHAGGPQLIETDTNGKIVWQVLADELPGISIKFASGLQRLPNGNTVFTNWLGHNHFGETSPIIEITREKKVVWTFADHAEMKTVSSIQLLDVSGDVTKGEILH